MEKFESVLHLPVDNLKERRNILETELSKTVVEILFTDLKKEINEQFVEYGITNASSISWEFYPESDDEGGTDWHYNHLSVKTIDNEYLDIDDYVVNRKSKYSEDFRDCYLNDDLYELMYGYRDDLYNHDIEEIDLT